ncbi:hypothetical protein PoB_002764500 [Plakobranchus ocellatus]|uniref:Uncharacterized protein n=1 Tax=Plakobranchus ocellatus TaxID=259542 RepID=A0AAV4A2J1_9GAST|nr:hypothetical protein PoB_002764500 [Plakobranchus ocellatus]
MAGLEPTTERSLQISGWTHKPLPPTPPSSRGVEEISPAGPTFSSLACPSTDTVTEIGEGQPDNCLGHLEETKHICLRPYLSLKLSSQGKKEKSGIQLSTMHSERCETSGKPEIA